VRKRRRKILRALLATLVGIVSLVSVGGAVPRQDDVGSRPLLQPVAARVLTPQRPQIDLTNASHSELFGGIIATGLMIRRMRRGRWI
jgi:hypothetical protein